VGHEIDSPICDFAADLRAPTPTAAAELLARPWSVLDAALAQARTDLAEGIRSRLDRSRLTLADYRSDRLQDSFQRILQPYYQRFDFARDSLRQGWQDRITDLRRRIELSKTALEALNPLAVLERGYALVTDDRGLAVPSTAGLEPGQHLTLRFHDGRTQVLVEEVLDEEL
jgi:exodeoxyribonuclease VII large subunit